MKRIISLLIITTLGCLCNTIMAQVKGHTFYAMEVQMGDNTSAELLLEMEDNGHLVLGEIMYKKAEAPIRLYGRRDRLEPNVIVLEEHLDNGQMTGKMTLNLQNDAVRSGEWRSADGEKLQPLMVVKSKPFPFGKKSSFFRPASGMEVGGHYVNYYRKGKAIADDYALNIMPYAPDLGLITLEHNAETKMANIYQLSGNTMLVTVWDETCTSTYEIRVFEDFVDIDPVLEPANAPEGGLGRLYVREQGVKEVTVTGYDDLYPVRARLEDGVPTLVVSKKRMAKAESYYGEISSGVKYGRNEIHNVQGRVRDIFLHTRSDFDCDQPYLCLLLENGKVQYLSMEYFLSTGVTTASHTLPNLENITCLTTYDLKKRAEQEARNEGDYEQMLGTPDMTDDEPDMNIGYAIDAAGDAHGIRNSEIEGDFMLNPKNTIDCDTYLGVSKTWEIHIIMHNDKGISTNYYGTYWMIENNAEKGTIVWGYEMDRKRVNDVPDAQTVPCEIRGTFETEYTEGEDIIFCPGEGLKFVPKGKKARFTRVHELG